MVLADLVDRAKIRMVQGGSSLRLTVEAAQTGNARICPLAHQLSQFWPFSLVVIATHSAAALPPQGTSTEPLEQRPSQLRRVRFSDNWRAGKKQQPEEILRHKNIFALNSARFRACPKKVPPTPWGRSAPWDNAAPKFGTRAHRRRGSATPSHVLSSFSN